MAWTAKHDRFSYVRWYRFGAGLSPDHLELEALCVKFNVEFFRTNRLPFDPRHGDRDAGEQHESVAPDPHDATT